MKTYRIKQVNAFTSKPFSGNPAGVVLDARGLSESKMQSIAREMNLSETAFILPSLTNNADMQIRWFTPAVEVALCGHATIGAFHALAEEEMHGMKRGGEYSFLAQTRSGLLAIGVEKKYSGTIIDFQLPVPQFHRIPALQSSMLTALGLKAGDLHTKLPVVRNAYLYVPVRRLTIVKRLQPDYTLLEKLTRRANIVGVCVFSLETMEVSSAVHSRFFAPAAGLSEDPVTGSANGPLGVYLYRYAFNAGLDAPWLKMPNGQMEFIGEQGDEINRKGRVKIRLAASNGKVERVSVAGEAVTIFNAELRV
ncbi:MAG: PhzF family phenazine biosynthesis protein [Ignavibacteriae bacterium]|nr:PhzF family phenazine biosynthesis protein [Ignavibacteriota bacterium]